MIKNICKKILPLTTAAALIIGLTTPANAYATQINNIEQEDSSIENYNEDQDNSKIQAYSATKPFYLHYVHSQAGSGANVTNERYSIRATGEDHISLTCTLFEQSIPHFGYMSESGVEYSLKSVPISREDEYTVYFSGNAIPRKGDPIHIILKLNGYGDSNPISAKGNFIY